MTYEDAKTYLDKSVADGTNLFERGWYLSWEQGDEYATLDGQFTAEALDAIATFMRGPSP